MIPALVIAPLAGATVFLAVGAVLARGLVGISQLTPFEIAGCYVAEAVLVLPIMLVWPAARRPPLALASAWGAAAACFVRALLSGPRPALVGWSLWLRGALQLRMLLWYGLAGAASGLVYAHLVKHPGAVQHD